MIKVRKLSYAYPTSTENVLDDLAFEISPGEIFGFLGPSGAGKSTTQGILYKRLRDYSGEVTIDGRSLKEWGSEYFERIGVGFELPNHYLKLTARENLRHFASFYQPIDVGKIETLSARFDLLDALDKRVEEFSKGMKMRLNFIRAILHDPPILFLDEPTSGLDPINAKKIKLCIAALREQGKTIFVTTHDMATADELCDRVSFLVEGKIRVTGVPSALKNEHGRHAVRVELEDGRAAEYPLDDIGVNREFLEFIASGAVLRIDTQEATLEEVFLKITGTILSE